MTGRSSTRGIAPSAFGDPVESVQQAMTSLAQAITDCAAKRVVWENAKSAGDSDVFGRAQAHRQAEALVSAKCEEAVVAYAAHLRSHVPQGGEQAVPGSGSPLGDAVV